MGQRTGREHAYKEWGEVVGAGSQGQLGYCRAGLKRLAINTIALLSHFSAPLPTRKIFNLLSSQQKFPPSPDHYLWISFYIDYLRLWHLNLREIFYLLKSLLFANQKGLGCQVLSPLGVLKIVI